MIEDRGFRHEALLYDGIDDLVERTVPFVRDGLERGEPVLAVLREGSERALRSQLGAEAGEVRFVDMEEVGANPARLTPLWLDFAAEHGAAAADAGSPRPRVRGIGEPAWAERSGAELSECAIHESLLDFAFAETALRDPELAELWLLCPYDAATLPPAALASAARNHPTLVGASGSRRSGSSPAAGAMPSPFAGELPTPPGSAERCRFDSGRLAAVRRLAGRRARDAGLRADRALDLELAVNELATNSVRHAGGTGELLLWDEPGAFACEVRDGGRINDPLAGRKRPYTDRTDGCGLWLVNQLCDLVQIRSGERGTAVRVQVGHA